MASHVSKPKRRRVSSRDPAEPKPKKVIQKKGYTVQGKAAQTRMCRWCYGSGKLDGKPCSWCKGTGHVKG